MNVQGFGDKMSEYALLKGTSRAAAKVAQEMLCGSISELCFN